MAKQYERIDPAHAAFIAQQRIFFTASAAATGRVNVSPRGSDAFRMVDPNITPIWTRPAVAMRLLPFYAFPAD